MDSKAFTAQKSTLEQILIDETAMPKPLPLSLLKDITNDFSNDREIGRSRFAVVYKGILGDKLVAVKKLSNRYMHDTEFHQEVQCLMKTNHKNVVRFLGYCAGKQGNLVMTHVQQRLFCFEYIPKGSLDKYITDAYREWQTCYKIIKGISEGLQFLHERHIIHLDLKPANILLDDRMVPKITNFDLSRCLGGNQRQNITKTMLGTFGYLAPEFYEMGAITSGTDLYSLGVIIIEILTGQKGYQDTEQVLESWSYKMERSQRDTLLEQIRVCYEIALECIDFNPKKRPTSARDIIERLHEMENIQLNVSRLTYDFGSVDFEHRRREAGGKEIEGRILSEGYPTIYLRVAGGGRRTAVVQLHRRKSPSALGLEGWREGGGGCWEEGDAARLHGSAAGRGRLGWRRGDVRRKKMGGWRLKKVIQSSFSSNGLNID
ncbi:putative receptor-like protein kinase At4g00960 [Hordeum vulgare subsp. vulgare]|uniref:putative receptor-like protein kinase At4g00960 n=1 Tax=Hordeum vulgare subsp. vulgare TaxID=112509 RepID=UPI001D1A41E8|nr:putative receptor-like protein kinase At4g00960 [Hordeum vulgare subsp. vulgare]